MELHTVAHRKMKPCVFWFILGPFFKKKIIQNFKFLKFIKTIFLKLNTQNAWFPCQTFKTMLRVLDPSERLMLRLHYCKSRCVRPLNLFALSHVLFPLELFNRGNLTPAVQPLINVICSGLNRDHGTTRKESSSPSWIITNPLHSSFIPLDQPWPGYSTGFAFLFLLLLQPTKVVLQFMPKRSR